MRTLIAIICIIVFGCATTGCRSTQRGAGTRPTNYIEPKTSEEANYAIRDRIAGLESELADARATVDRLRSRLDSARAEIASIRKSSATIGELSRRSTESIQEIIEQMEALSVWINWAVDRIQYLESLLTDEGD